MWLKNAKTRELRFHSFCCEGPVPLQTAPWDSCLGGRGRQVEDISNKDTFHSEDMWRHVKLWRLCGGTMKEAYGHFVRTDYIPQQAHSDKWMSWFASPTCQDYRGHPPASHYPPPPVAHPVASQSIIWWYVMEFGHHVTNVNIEGRMQHPPPFYGFVLRYRLSAEWCATKVSVVPFAPLLKEYIHLHMPGTHAWLSIIHGRSLGLAAWNLRSLWLSEVHFQGAGFPAPPPGYAVHRTFPEVFEMWSGYARHLLAHCVWNCMHVVKGIVCQSLLAQSLSFFWERVVTKQPHQPKHNLGLL